MQRSAGNAETAPKVRGSFGEPSCPLRFVFALPCCNLLTTSCYRKDAREIARSAHFFHAHASACAPPVLRDSMLAQPSAPWEPGHATRAFMILARATQRRTSFREQVAQFA